MSGLWSVRKRGPYEVMRPRIGTRADEIIRAAPIYGSVKWQVTRFPNPSSLVSLALAAEDT